MRKLLFVALLGAAFLCGAVQNGVTNADAPANLYAKFPKAQLDSVVHITTVWHLPGTEEPQRFFGSGVAISPTRILTAKHLVEEDGMELVGIEITVYGLPNKGRLVLDGTLFKASESADLALIDIDTSILRPSQLDLTAAVEPGDPVFVVGGPSGLVAQFVSFGYIANVQDEPLFNNEVDAGAQGLFASSNAIAGGNSGGPVYNANTMQVIGILVAGTRAPNVALFVPLTLAKGILK